MTAAADLTAEHVGQMVQIAPLRSARRLLEVEQGGPFQIPGGLSVPYRQDDALPPGFDTHLILERVPEEDGPGGPDGDDPGYPLHLWCVPYAPVTLSEHP